MAGTVDAFAAWIGTGTIERGSVCNSVGTTDGVAIVWDRPLEDPRGRIQAMPNITGRDWILGGAMSSGGIMLDWFVRCFYSHVADPYRLVEQEAASVPVGAEGLIALPYLVGERSPIFDPNARSVFFGIGEHHTRAHFARAVLESVAFAVRDVCEVLTDVGSEIAEVRVAGGGARSNVWNWIKADVLGCRVLVPEEADSSLLGAAVIAAWGAGYFASLSDASKAMVRFRAVVEPDFEHHAIYTRLFEFYKELYAHLRDDFARLERLMRGDRVSTPNSEPVSGRSIL